MATYSPEALGRTVRAARRRANLTQEQLGRAAGYRGGAGVAISRLESGQMEPGPERFEGIAAALGLSPEALAAAATAATATLAGAGHGDAVSLKDRATDLKRELDHRARTVEHLGQEFNDAHARARDGFLLRLVDSAAGLRGAPRPDPNVLTGETPPGGSAVEAEAGYALRFTKFGVTKALAAVSGGRTALADAQPDAFSKFTAAVARGVFDGTDVDGLTSVTATGGLLAASRVAALATRRAATVGGAALTAAIVAPVAGAAVGGLVLMVQRFGRRQIQEQAARLDEAETEIASTRPRVEALFDLMPRATWVLDYIAQYGGHALDRWQAQVGTGPLDWNSLGEDERASYEGFVDIAAAQLAVLAIDFHALLEGPDDELARATSLADETLTRAKSVVTLHV